MKSLNPYVMFSGNCKEALTFYEDCLGGEIVSMQTFGDSPVDVPDDAKDRIFNSEFRAGDAFFMASDDLPSHEVTRGTNVALFLVFSDMEEQQDAFGRLSEGGKVLFPLANGFGMLTDKYGIQWMLAGK